MRQKTRAVFADLCTTSRRKSWIYAHFRANRQKARRSASARYYAPRVYVRARDLYFCDYAYRGVHARAYERASAARFLSTTMGKGSRRVYNAVTLWNRAMTYSIGLIMPITPVYAATIMSAFILIAAEQKHSVVSIHWLDASWKIR